MDIEQAKIDILQWIEKFVEAPHPALGGWSPCPYARRARLDNKVDIRAGSDDLYQDLAEVKIEHWDVIALVYDPIKHDCVEFENTIQLANQEILTAKNMIALGDHPDEIEDVNGVVMNQGKWALIFVQDLLELNDKAKQLGDKGFYDTWPDEYLNDLFLHRKDPR